MGKIVVSELLSLDRVMEAPGGESGTVVLAYRTARAGGEASA